MSEDTHSHQPAWLEAQGYATDFLQQAQADQPIPLDYFRALNQLLKDTATSLPTLAASAADEFRYAWDQLNPTLQLLAQFATAEVSKHSRPPEPTPPSADGEEVWSSHTISQRILHARILEIRCLDVVLTCIEQPAFDPDMKTSSLLPFLTSATAIDYVQERIGQ